MNKKILHLIFVFIIFAGAVFSQDTYVLLGWNDLGMHCSNKYFDKIAVLPPFNNIYAQLILKRQGQLPQIVNNGYKIEYSIPGNTYSVGKTDFWQYAQILFQLPNPLPNNIGLTGKGLTGLMDTTGNGFRVIGVPNTPYTDNNLVTEAPFQTFHLVAKTMSGTELTFTDNVIPVSNEIGCIQSGCHTSEQQIKNGHPPYPGYDPNAPTLCAKCHASNAIGLPGIPEAKTFSYRMHNKHKFIQPETSSNTCYKCHPGPNTQCFRDPMSNTMPCQACHGTMTTIATSIQAGRRPWLDEPKCGSCHGPNHSENTGKLYKDSKEHAGLYCSACHGSPHAVYPSREANDNLQSIRVQGHAGTVNDCMICHSTPPTGAGPHGIFYVGMKQINSEIPSSFSLSQNYPNPFNPVTSINFSIPENGFTNLSVYDILGIKVKELVNENFKSGDYSVNFDAENLSSGAYFYTIRVNDFTATKKMLLIK